MKKTLKAWIMAFVILILAVICVWVGVTKFGKGSQVSAEIEFQETDVSVNYRDTVYLPEYFGKKDNFSNAQLYSPSEEQISMKDGYLYADTLGIYKLVLLESRQIYNLIVEDKGGPIIRLGSQSTTVYWGETVTIDPTVVDNVDGNIKKATLDYTLKKRNLEIQTNGNQFVADELGEYILEFDVQDEAGNKADPICITCEMPKAIVKPIGEKIAISNDIFKGLEKEGETYTYDVAITRVSEEETKSVKGNSFVIEKNAMYRISQTAIGGEEELKLNYIYRSDNFWKYDFDDQDISMLNTTTHTVGLSVAEVDEGNYATNLKVTSEGWIFLTVSGLEPNTVYDRIGFDVVCTKASRTDDESIKISFYNGIGENGHTIVRELGKSQPSNFSKIKTDRFGIAKIYGYIHDNGTTEFTFDNMIVQKSAAVNMAKGVYVSFTGSSKLLERTNPNQEYKNYKMPHIDVLTYGYNTLTIFTTKEAGLKANTNYYVTLDVACDGEFPAFYEAHGEHGWENDFVLGEPGGKIQFRIKTDNTGVFTKEWDTIYMNQPQGLTYVDFTAIAIEEDRGSIYGEGVTVEAKPIDSKFTALKMVVKEGQNAGKNYTRMEDIKRYGNVDLTIAANKKAKLKANTTYRVTVDVACDGEFPSFYEAHGENGWENDFVFGNPGGKIQFKIKTDAKGEFVKEWKTAYINHPQGITYVDFTAVKIEEDKGTVYGKGISVTAKALDAKFTAIDKVVTGGKTYTRIENIERYGNLVLTIAANKEAKLKANTTYRVTVDVACDGKFPSFYEAHGENGWENDFIFGEPGGKIQFKIKTDAKGEFSKEWKTAYINHPQGITYIDFTDVEIEEDKGTVYGEGISVTVKPLDAKFTAIDKVVTGGKTYTRIENIERYGNLVLTIAANKEAKLKANTTYRVTVDVACDGEFPSFYEAHGENGWENDFVFGNPGGKIQFEVKTDAKGEFSKEWQTAYINHPQGITYVDFTDVKLEEDKGTVYGEGVSVSVKPLDAKFSALDKVVTEGSDAGKTYTRIENIERYGNLVLTIAANKKAKLKANTNYFVTVDVTCDGEFPSFYEAHGLNGWENDFVFGEPGGKIKFSIQTNAEGEFSKEWQTAYINHPQGITFIDFNDVEIVEDKGTVYGDGISVKVTPRDAIFSVVNKPVEDGDNEGKTFTRIEDIKKYGYAVLTVSADEKAKLRANTEYKVTLDVGCDGEFPSFYEEHAGGNEFVFGNPGGKIEFLTKTDADGKFTKEWQGIYINHPQGITYVDFKKIKINEVKKSVYGEGVTVTPEPTHAEFTVVEKRVTDGENAGKIYTGIKDIAKNGFSKLTVAANTKAGLRANTKYKVVVDVECDGLLPSFYEEHEGGNDFILGNPGGKIEFTVTTDAKGEFSKQWTTVYLNILQKLSYVDYTGVEITEIVDSVYGRGVTISAAPRDAVFTVGNKTITEGANAGKTYTSIGNISKYGWSTLTVVANEEAGLKPNTEYEVTLDVACDGERPSYYEAHGPYGWENDFILGNPGGEITFRITTDENGTFTKEWNTIYVNWEQGITYVDFKGIEISEFVTSIYGKGISVTTAPVDAIFTSGTKTFTDGENVGRTYTGIENIQKYGNSKLTIAADSEAGLKPNTKYRVVLDVACDGTFPSYFEAHNGGNDFVLGNPGGQVKFDITTDDKGLFTKEWTTIYINQPQGITYVSFTGIEIVEDKTVYGKDISVKVAPRDAIFTSVDKMVTDGENAGKTYTRIENIQKYGYLVLTVAAGKDSGLKPNTTYNVAVDVACDGDFPSFYEDHTSGNDFVFGNPGGTINFTVTTDANGAFTKEWNTIYINHPTGITYVDFKGVTFTEK